MGLACFSLALALFTVAFAPAADACIPTKTPQPGIPAVTMKPPETCPPITEYSEADCMAANPNKMCGPATITPTMISCDLAGWTVYTVTPGKTGTLADVFKCVGTTWMVSGFPLADLGFTGTPIQVACVS